MSNNKILSGSQLRQYLHISTRKMKYLMDHNIIPHNDTGQATHKYEILQSDADEYLERVKNDPSFMKETVGLFNSRKKLIRCPEPPEPPTKKSAEAVAGYLTTIWREHPDILSTSLAGKLIGANRQYIRRQHMSGELKCISIRGDIFCLKKDLIAFICTPERLASPPTIVVRDILRAA